MRNREKEESVRARGRGRPSGLALLLNFFAPYSLCDQTNEWYTAALSFGAVYYALSNYTHSFQNTSYRFVFTLMLKEIICHMLG